ncbi:GntR family transcriptional regulator [Pararhodobacter oceanensis]|uniref:GntR family transcriptional regulator n=1 Tax=Pararhodobacter oceanensis TaxID=2172121 RepID=UPI003A958BFC
MTEPIRHSWTDIRDRIHARLLDRTYRPGDKLPRDEDIAQDLGCARSTVQRAMRDLADAGLVERKRKGGTTVRADPVTRATLDVPITRAEVEALGSVYGYHLLLRDLAVTPPAIAATLALRKPVEMLHVEALHLADQRPYILEDRWISLETSPEILGVDLAMESANEWLVRNKPYSRCDLRLYAIEANARTALQLDTPVGAALLVIERTTWINEAPITTVRSVTKPGYQMLTQI